MPRARTPRYAWLLTRRLLRLTACGGATLSRAVERQRGLARGACPHRGRAQLDGRHVDGPPRHHDQLRRRVRQHELEVPEQLPGEAGAARDAVDAVRRAKAVDLAEGQPGSPRVADMRRRATRRPRRPTCAASSARTSPRPSTRSISSSWASASRGRTARACPSGSPRSPPRC